MEVYCDKCLNNHLRPVGRRCDILVVRQASAYLDNMSAQEPSLQESNDIPLAQGGPSRVPDVGSSHNGSHNASSSDKNDSSQLILTELKALATRISNIEQELQRPQDTVTSTPKSGRLRRNTGNNTSVRRGNLNLDASAIQSLAAPVPGPSALMPGRTSNVTSMTATATVATRLNPITSVTSHVTPIQMSAGVTQHNQVNFHQIYGHNSHLPVVTCHNANVVIPNSGISAGYRLPIIGVATTQQPEDSMAGCGLQQTVNQTSGCNPLVSNYNNAIASHFATMMPHNPVLVSRQQVHPMMPVGVQSGSGQSVPAAAVNSGHPAQMSVPGTQGSYGLNNIGGAPTQSVVQPPVGTQIHPQMSQQVPQSIAQYPGQPGQTWSQATGVAQPYPGSLQTSQTVSQNGQNYLLPFPMQSVVTPSVATQQPAAVGLSTGGTVSGMQASAVPYQAVGGQTAYGIPSLNSLRSTAVDQDKVQQRFNQLNGQVQAPHRGNDLSSNDDNRRKKVDITWPQNCVYVGPERNTVTYNELTLSQFTAGFLNSVLVETNALYRSNMIVYMAHLFQSINDIGFVSAKGAHHVLLKQMEEGLVTWGDLHACNEIRKQYTVMVPTANATESSAPEVSKGKNKKGKKQYNQLPATIPCPQYQQNKCDLEDGHGRGAVTYRHVCKYCLYQFDKLANHCDKFCPWKKSKNGGNA